MHQSYPLKENNNNNNIFLINLRWLYDDYKENVWATAACMNITLHFLLPLPGWADLSGQAVQRWRSEGASVSRPLRLLPGRISLLPGHPALHQRSRPQLRLPWIPGPGRCHATPRFPDDRHCYSEQWWGWESGGGQIERERRWTRLNTEREEWMKEEAGS